MVAAEAGGRGWGHGGAKGLAIGVFAVLDGVYAESVRVFFGVADAVVADTQALLFSLALELFDVA